MSKKKILCIDDSINLLQVLKRRFEFDIEDVEVFITDNGEEGLRIARTEKPALIILDISMPEMDGSQVLEALKHSTPEGESSTKDIPVIILTSHGPEERAKFIAAGALDYISSPFDTTELVDKVKKALASSSAS